jgi:hypothetical protein
LRPLALLLSMTTASSRDFGYLSPNRLSCNLRVMNNFQQFGLIAYGKALQSSSFVRGVKAVASDNGAVPSAQWYLLATFSRAAMLR